MNAQAHARARAPFSMAGNNRIIDSLAHIPPDPHHTESLGLNVLVL